MDSISNNILRGAAGFPVALDFPEHLQNKIFLSINPKYFHLWKIFYQSEDPNQISQYEQKWYLEFCSKTQSIDPEKSLIRSLELEYYDFFNQLFSQYLQSLTGEKSPSISLLNRLLNIAAKNCTDINYVNKFISLGANNYNSAMAEAAYGCSSTNIEIIKLMIDLMNQKRINPNYDLAMWVAARCGHLEIVKLMLNLAPKNYQFNYNDAMKQAAQYGHIEIVKLMLNSMDQKRIAPNYNSAMGKAAEISSHTNIEIIKLMLDLGANNYSYVREYAAKLGHTDIVNLIKEYEL